MLADVLRVLYPQTVVLVLEAIYMKILEPEKYPRPPKGILPKHLGLFVLHWLITGEAFDYYCSAALDVQISKSFIKPGIDYILARVGPFTTTWLAPRPLEQLQPLVREFYNNLGLDAPGDKFKKIMYVGDGKHYLFTKVSRMCCRPF